MPEFSLLNAIDGVTTVRRCINNNGVRGHAGLEYGCGGAKRKALQSHDISA